MDTTQGQNKKNIEFKKVLNDIEILTNIYDHSFEGFLANKEFSKFEYLENFVDELNDSFLKNMNKNDTLKYYLSELAFWNRYFNVDNYNLVFKNNSTESDLSISEKGILEANYIFEIILNEITLCCSIYDLDFYKLCNEINFDYSYIDTGLIGVFNKENTESKQTTELGIKAVKIGDKWYALQYYFELVAHGNPIPFDIEGGFSKSALEGIGKEKCKSKGQGFYRAFKDIDINNSERIKREYGKNWIEQIVELSKNDEVTIDYINRKYMSGIS